MPPHLHPRSRMTSSLFATTVLASFLVVALPHVLPCPVPRTKYADGEVVVDEHGRRRRWRSSRGEQQQQQDQDQQQQKQQQRLAQPDAQGIVQFDQVGGERRDEARRECPVPKPRGVVGEWLGFGRDGDRGG
ncbi:hypothetical protein ESCO_002901 [Escovopsis weberi]|uniref:Uncharacterized protein n=1 Tax=Escovopsis weberi TaxID=150374 RepID=A0A0M8N081_ESCWE|nr:hypothetical protein ESCO_002901 [Escovopsis weberi]